MLLAPDGEVTVEARAEPAAATEVALEPRSLAGGLGAHKWLDRPQDPAWLAVDLDGAVLEAAWANVWIEDGDGALLTPPADGRILPGITRDRLLAAVRGAREAALTLADLGSAPAILLSSSVRLVTPAGTGRHALREGARARRAAARRPRNLHENAVVHSLTQPQVHCRALRNASYARTKARPRVPAPRGEEGSRLTKRGPRKVDRPVRREVPARA